MTVQNRGTSAVPPGSVTRLTVGDTTLNHATGGIAAGASTTVAVDGEWTATNGGATLSCIFATGYS
ncbi:hypothetical protein [Streptomyces sp. NPDC086838]|uniref:hypothetical protein n=1 Tax=Streptomyces sp. NPDC086838 TaxID=3365762 RepID=UPI00382242DC